MPGTAVGQSKGFTQEPFAHPINARKQAMQDIATKIARVRPVAKAAGLTADQMRHLIHGTGGSPRRAKRAIKAGIAEQLIETYQAALEDEGSHAGAVIKCNE